MCLRCVDMCAWQTVVCVFLRWRGSAPCSASVCHLFLPFCMRFFSERERLFPKRHLMTVWRLASLNAMWLKDGALKKWSQNNERLLLPRRRRRASWEASDPVGETESGIYWHTLYIIHHMHCLKWSHNVKGYHCPIPGVQHHRLQW